MANTNWKINIVTFLAIAAFRYDFPEPLSGKENYLQEFGNIRDKCNL